MYQNLCMRCVTACLKGWLMTGYTLRAMRCECCQRVSDLAICHVQVLQ